ncbi:ABC transporter substrate-binding protein [Streptomyces sp. NPDC056291]|uniref:ABC transporter substrate-binding protein n=1 Tax=Streptomyces sp. NPDC056291 TaxID=3345772 RepID=UPI0035E3148D
MPGDRPEGLEVRKRAFVAVAIASVISLAGCGKPAQSPSADRSAATGTLVDTPAPKGDVDRVTWNVPYGEPTSLDPLKSYNYPENEVLSNLCESLMRVNPDFSVTPGLAESADHPTPTTWVYNLRKGVKFWDGKEMTADDVVFSLKRHLDPAEGSYWAGDMLTGNIASVKKTGAYQVTVTLKKPDVVINDYMATPLGAVTEAAFTRQAGAKFGTPDKGVMCTGPFALKKWDKGSQVTLVRNDAYWDESRKAKAKEFDFRFIVDPATLTNALKTGEIDGSYDVPTDAVDQLSNATNGTLYLGKSMQMVAIIGTGDGPFSDPRVRTALLMATDREAISKTVFAGTAAPLRSVVPPGSYSYASKVYEDAYAKLLPTTVDIEGAKKLVQEAGKPSGPITIAYPSERTVYEDILAEVQSAGKKIGLDIQPKGVPSARYGAFFSDAEARKGYSGFMTTNYFDVPEPLAFLRNHIDPGSAENYDKFSAPEITALLDQASAENDDTKRAEFTAQIETKYMAKTPWLPIVAPSTRLFMNSKITGAPASFVYLYYPWAAAVGSAK